MVLQAQVALRLKCNRETMSPFTKKLGLQEGFKEQVRRIDGVNISDNFCILMQSSTKMKFHMLKLSK